MVHSAQDNRNWFTNSRGAWLMKALENWWFSPNYIGSLGLQSRESFLIQFKYSSKYNLERVWLQHPSVTQYGRIWSLRGCVGFQMLYTWNYWVGTRETQYCEVVCTKSKSWYLSKLKHLRSHNLFKLLLCYKIKHIAEGTKGFHNHNRYKLWFDFPINKKQKKE